MNQTKDCVTPLELNEPQIIINPPIEVTQLPESMQQAIMGILGRDNNHNEHTEEVGTQLEEEEPRIIEVPIDFEFGSQTEKMDFLSLKQSLVEDNLFVQKETEEDVIAQFVGLEEDDIIDCKESLVYEEEYCNEKKRESVTKMSPVILPKVQRKRFRKTKSKVPITPTIKADRERKKPRRQVSKLKSPFTKEKDWNSNEAVKKASADKPVIMKIEAEHENNIDCKTDIIQESTKSDNVSNCLTYKLPSSQKDIVPSQGRLRKTKVATSPLSCFIYPEITPRKSDVTNRPRKIESNFYNNEIQISTSEIGEKNEANSKKSHNKKSNRNKCRSSTRLFRLKPDEKLLDTKKSQNIKILERFAKSKKTDLPMKNVQKTPQTNRTIYTRSKKITNEGISHIIEEQQNRVGNKRKRSAEQDDTSSRKRRKFSLKTQLGVVVSKAIREFQKKIRTEIFNTLEDYMANCN